MVDVELRELLDIDEDKSLEHYFFPSGLISRKTQEKMFRAAMSPLDMAKYVKKSAPQWLVKNIIQYQFDIRWNTDTGEPADYKFSQFCDKENTTNHLKYFPRQAHVKAILYKECRKKSVYDLRRITKNELCPKVYIRTAHGWKSWQADGRSKFKDVNIKNDFSWIDPSICKFIKENADEQKVKSLKDSLAKPTLYWAVLEDGDFVAGKKQVYVGKADNGIRGRWIINGDNHCAMMEKCLDNVCGMTTYDPSTLKGIQLVDARLALAKVREEKTALFVIKTFGDDVEKAEINQQKIEIRLKEVKESLQNKVFSRGITRASLKKEKRQLQKKCNKAIAATDRLKSLKINKSKALSEAKAQLREAEISHRDGKRVDESHRNIIPYDDYEMTWKPTNMGYGMNCN